MNLAADGVSVGCLAALAKTVKTKVVRKGKLMCLGIPGKITQIWEEAGTRMSTVDFGGTTKTVCLAYLPDIECGEYAIVHAGFAITRLDEASAQETLAMFSELGVLQEELSGTQGQDTQGQDMQGQDRRTSA